jgi:hypothetical protein
MRNESGLARWDQGIQVTPTVTAERTPSP